MHFDWYSPGFHLAIEQTERDIRKRRDKMK